MYVDAAHDRVFLRCRNPQAIHNLFPDVTEDVAWRNHNIALPHTIESVKILRNLGIVVPSPIRHRYDWPRPARIKQPFAHQITTSEFLTLHRKGFVWNEMGTAKTASALWAADYMMNEGYVHKAIIVAPLSTLHRVWRDEIFNFIMHRTAVVLHCEKERRQRLLAADVDFYITNYEGLEIIGPELAKRKDIDLMIIDEVAAYRNHATKRYKTLVKSIRPKMRLWLLTGTPCPNGPHDAWALAKLTDANKVPVYFTTWKRRVMQQVSTHKWIPRPGSEAHVHAALQPAIRFRKKDCLDLPQLTYESREVGLTSEQRKLFNRMKQHMVIEAAGEEISAVSAADKIGKLRQILCGAMKNPNTGEYITLPHAPRLNVLLECIEQASAKVLVIVPFKGILRTLYDEMKDTHSCAFVNGDVTAKRRDAIWHQFKHEKDPHTVLCHPQVMAHGLTLVEADTMVFYGPIYSNEQAQQVVERINRPGQTRPMTVIRLGGHWMEWDIYGQVEGRRVTQESMLDLYNRILTDDSGRATAV